MKNVGEGIAILGIMVAVGLTQNYWLLLLLVLPIITLSAIDNDTRNKYNNYNFRKSELELEKLRQEIRLLKKTR